jgi:hypothetical protein
VGVGVVILLFAFPALFWTLVDIFDRLGRLIDFARGVFARAS